MRLNFKMLSLIETVTYVYLQYGDKLTDQWIHMCLLQSQLSHTHNADISVKSFMIISNSKMGSKHWKPASIFYLLGSHRFQIVLLPLTFGAI